MENNKGETSKSEGWIVLIPRTRKEIKLDKKDRMILQALLENARTSLRTLSKITKLSKNSVVNRMNNYEKIGLTKGSSSFINIHKLGFDAYQIGIKTKMTLTQKEKFIEHLKKVKFLNQVMVLASSHWDFFVRLYAKDSKHFDSIITEINLFPNIIHLDILPIEAWNFSPTKYISPELNLNKFIKKEDSSFQKTFSARKNNNEKILFDKKDLEILNIISHNARIPLVEIASKVNLSPDTIKYRIKNLVKKRVIENFFINLNPFL
ncbi:MAG: AsnC family transcriptional regulator, partial [Nanoarchaeota archaeon]|nr:AsnC family transcriptional regulator [Nanoarchaeota archaeon]